MSPYLKAVTPALLVIFATVISAVNTGEFNLPEVEVGIVGLAAATVAFLVSNGTTGFSRYAKALGPAALTLIAIGVHFVVTNEWDETETRIAVAGLLSAFVTFLVPNVPARLKS